MESPRSSCGTDGMAELLEQALQEAESVSPSSSEVSAEKLTKAGEPEEQEERRGMVAVPYRRAAFARLIRGSLQGVCIRCGELLPEDAAPSNLALRYIHEGLTLSSDEADRVRSAEMKRVVAERKLLLILDLDHTLLNSTRLTDLSEKHHEALCRRLKEEKERGERSLHCLPHIGLWTKLRPGVDTFLEALREQYELYIYTHGDAAYAAEMAKLLDPERRYFGQRIMSQSDSTSQAVKNLDIVLGAEQAVLVLDDTSAVWPAHQANLITADRYVFFPACAHRFLNEAPSLLEAGQDESATLGMLASAQEVLQEVHARFFEAHDAGAPMASLDVREILAQVRRKVLEGCHVVFSGLIPVGDPNPEATALWQLAEKLGASCSTVLNPSTTHLVARIDGTDKVREARRQGCQVVSPSWLLASSLLMRRADAGAHPVQPSGAGRAGKNDKWNGLLRSPAADLALARDAAAGGRSAASASVPAPC